MTTWLQHFDIRDRRNFYIALTTPILTYYTARALWTVLSSSHPRERNPKIFVSPRKSLQLLSAQELDDLPYPPDALPGARDVDSPYGNIRVYEWGPEDGRKVLFVHGITTPCIAFAGLAKRLVDGHGCRVMLFDLFGRGYSDAPDPEEYHQDIRLFTSQILLVLASSDLAWTGSERFTLVGYSLGGCIAAAFTYYFPRLVGSLTLIAPAGLIRLNHISFSSKLLYGDVVPHSLVNAVVRRRLAAGPTHMAARKDSKTDPAKAAESEVPAHPAHAEHSTALLFPGRPNISPLQTVAWLARVHPGFAPSFSSSLKHAPITAQHERWKMIGSRQAAQRASPSSAAASREALKEGKVLILLGRDDQVIIAEEVGPDATAALGSENVKVVTLKGAHDVPIVNAEGCVGAMTSFWEKSM
ncbi:hypothetical protein BAUCODRAFT_73833 [Baudoinia panamericana UAMH 10762]|uniref:AB hydrolase-1 domain-containing protein n=1 Tax=Baudoinia panamericana (strain UAMH 10762) TaxID=717646 RepID=M2N664_BAUPA|nr:uncharacterized protein BAUCODRAFT_73833 [Baudoinia panamericana UAMH 10762]EMC94509.1 hypothetical protein BAUCODRAFT_73833 [Baudoinia panamericana UAMH 10762]